MVDRRKIKRTFTLQLDSSDCGVACLRSIIRYHGGDVSTEVLRELSGTSRNGTTFLGLQQAATEFDLIVSGFENADIPDLASVEAPLMLHVRLDNGLEHYVIWYGRILKSSEMPGSCNLIGDPADGIIEMSDEALYDIWKSRKLLTVEPTDRFQTKSNKRQIRIDWLKSMLKDQASLLTATVVVGIFMAALGVSMTIFSQKLIDDLLPGKNKVEVFGGLVLLTLLLIVRAVLEALRTRLLLDHYRVFNSRMIADFMHILLHLPKRFFDSRKTGDMIARLHDTQRVQRLIAQLIGATVVEFLMALISLGVMFFYSWSAAMILVLCIPVYFGVVYHFHRPIMLQQRNVMAAYAQNESNYINTFQGIRTIKATNQEELFENRCRDVYRQLQDCLFSLGSTQNKLTATSHVVGVVILCGLLAYGCYEVLNERMKPGEMMAILGICISVLPVIANLALLAVPFGEAAVALDRLDEYKQVKLEDAGQIGQGLKLPAQVESLEINDLVFRFPGKGSLFNGLSMRLCVNGITGLAGESGRGKSTLIQIIEGFYPFDSGQLTLNNARVQLNDYPLRVRRELIATVPQEVEIFPGTVMENILWFKSDRTTDQVSAEDVVFFEQPFFAKFYSTLPQGLQTLTGDSGIKISGGQKQWIGLMRALIRRPRILLLDEATSAMDAENEVQVLNLLNTLKPHMMVLFVSHRLRVFPGFCDAIYVLQEGKALLGTHQELLMTDNIYSRYWIGEKGVARA